MEVSLVNSYKDVSKVISALAEVTLDDESFQGLPMSFFNNQFVHIYVLVANLTRVHEYLKSSVGSRVGKELEEILIYKDLKDVFKSLKRVKYIKGVVIQYSTMVN